MKTLVVICFAAALAIPAFAGSPEYQSGKILAFDTGLQRAKNVKHAPKDEVVYQVQVEGTIYKVTNHTKRQDFSAGEEVRCRVEKTHLIIEKLKGGEVKYEILGESTQPERAGTTP